MDVRHPDFRHGTELATSFTATLSERHGQALERIPTPDRLADWFRFSGLPVDSCTAADLERAQELRESIHLAAAAAALGNAAPEHARRIINECSTRGQVAPVLTVAGERQWERGAATAVEAALGRIAADAIDIIAGERDGRLALCASPTCRAAFFDTSRGRTRRWCDMNTCGNKQKKERLGARTNRS